MKVETDMLEHCLLGPEESEVDIWHIAMNARSEKRRRLFHIFSGQGQSEFLVVSAARWDEYSRMRARQEEECQELNKVIQFLSDRQGKLFVMMERKRNWMSEAWRIFENRYSKKPKEEMELLERKRILEVLLKEVEERGCRRCTGSKWLHSAGNRCVSKVLSEK